MIPTSDTTELINISVQSISAIITSVAAVVTVIIAYFGLQTWKEQLRGKSEYELAKRLLVHIYQLRKAISSVRNRWQDASEIGKAMNEDKLLGEQSNDPHDRVKIEQALYDMRWKGISEAFAILEVDRLEAEAVWGHKIDELMKPIIGKVMTLRLAVNTHLIMLQHNPEQLKEEDQPYFKVLYNFQFESSIDPFSEELNKAIENMSTHLKPYLKLN